MNKNIQTITILNVLFVLSNIILIFYYISIWILNDFEEKGYIFAFMWFILIVSVGLFVGNVSYAEEEAKKGKKLTDEDKEKLAFCSNVVIILIVGFGVLMLNLLKIDHKEKNICNEKNIYIETEEENE